MDENTYGMEIPLGEYTKTSCKSLDFKKCSLNELGIDFPRLFQFDHEQHMYV